MHVSFALFADAANLSQEGKLNVLGVFDAVHAATFPSLHPRATLVVRLKGTAADAGTHTMGLRWYNPAGTELWSSSAELTVGVPPAGHTTELDMPVIAAVDLPLDMPGNYRMLVDLDAALRSEVTLHVHGPVAGARPTVPGMVS
jgi:hypothetical protein